MKHIRTKCKKKIFFKTLKNQQDFKPYTYIVILDLRKLFAFDANSSRSAEQFYIGLCKPKFQFFFFYSG